MENISRAVVLSESNLAPYNQSPMTSQLPTQQQLFLPLLTVLRENGPMRAGEACDAVASQIGVAGAVRERTSVLGDGQEVNLFNRRVRWTRQNAVLAGMISKDIRGVWHHTESGEKTDVEAKAGIVVTVYAAPEGCLLWSEARTALQYVEDSSVTAVITSPPYPLVRSREYDRGHSEWSQGNYLNTLIDHIEAIRPKLSEDGTFVLNLGPAFLPGQLARNPYQHRLLGTLVDRLGWHLMDEHYWINPAKPKTTPQVTVRKTHCSNQVEQVFLLSRTGKTKCSTLRVLNPYTPRHQTLISKGGEVVTSISPSAIKTPGVRFGGDNGGSIPGNVHTMTHDSDFQYRRFCKERGITAHPAMMPIKLAEFFVSLTSEPGDLILDPFGGSGKVAAAALNLDRRFITSERRLDYLMGAMSRLPASRT